MRLFGLGPRHGECRSASTPVTATQPATSLARPFDFKREKKDLL
jgi:hypothetical protein